MVSGHQTSRSPLIGHRALSPLTAGLVLSAGFTFVAGLSAIGARASYGARLTADEPQYLLTAISIAEDFDLDISDELAEERFRDFHELPLDPQTAALDPSGRRVSPHDPLLPVLLALPLALGGWVAAKITMAALAAATAAATVWLAVRRFDVTVPTATWTTAALFSAPPLVAYGSQIYPEMPAALLVVIGVAAVTGPPSARAQVAALIAIIGLPWLAIKYVPAAAVIAVAAIAPLIPQRRRRVLALAAILSAAGALYLAAHQRIYGGWTVYAAGDHFVGGEFQVVGTDPDYLGRSRRLIGLLVDRGFGLMAWTPAYAMLVPGLASVPARRGGRGRGQLILIATTAAGWAMATWVALTMHGWWWPGRQLVVVLPLAVVAMAGLVDRRPGLRRLLVAGALVGTINWFWLAVEATTGRRTLVVDFTDTANPLYRTWSALFPDHRIFGPADVVLTAVWGVILGIAGVAAWRAESRPTGSEPAPATGPEPVTVTTGTDRDPAGTAP